METTSFGPENFTSGTTNNTTIQSKDSNIQIIFLCIVLGTFIVGFIGNGLVISLTGCRMKTTVNSIWFLNLAIADFNFILSFIILNCIINFSSYIYIFFRPFIYILSIVIKQNLLASIFFLVVISLDRCLCTWMAVWARNNRTVFRARIICVIVWVLSLCYCIPFIIGFSDKFLLIYEFLVGFLIPFLIIASSHIVIGVRIKRLKIGKQLRSYRVIIAVVLTFFICCFPFFLCCFCEITMDNWRASDIVISLCRYLVYLNSCLNPILYVLMSDEYKKKLKQSLLLVLETAFAEDNLDAIIRQATTLEFVTMSVSK